MLQASWYVRIADEVLGPMSEAELRDLVQKGVVGPNTPVSSGRSIWTNAGQAFGMTALPPSPRAPADRTPVKASKPSIHPGWIVGGVMFGGLAVLVCGSLLLTILGAVVDSSDRLEMAASQEGPHARADSFAPAQADLDVDEDLDYRVPRSTRRPVLETSTARLAVRFADATDELFPIAQRLSQEEQAALGIMVLATGMDIYGARVSLTNTGDVPIRVYPQNLHVHFGNESAVVYTIDDPSFLRPCVLQPGASTSGLVTYIARMDIGASMRLGGGMSYDDSTIEVTYP